MILVLDVGNSQIYCGVFQQEELISQFRYASTGQSTSDEIGVFLRSALRENGVDPEAVQIVAISSVVPELNYTLRSCCQKYFSLEPMILRPWPKDRFEDCLQRS
jgi:type III pantothenate kinase